MTEIPQTPASFTAPKEPSPPPQTVPFRFTGSASEFFRIWIVNTLLTILTLGIYSAWAKVRTKQYFHRHTWLDDASFEYLANPINILKGRILIAIVLGAVSISQHYAPVVYLVLVIGLMLSTPWVVVKALSFNAKNSALRNVRFSFRGTTADSFVAYLAGMAVYIFTCGLGMPYMQWRISQFAVNDHYYGRSRFSFRTPVGDYFITFLVGAGISLALMSVFVAAMITPMFLMGDAEDRTKGAEMMVYIVPLFYVLMVVPAAYMKAQVANLFWGGISVGEHELESDQTFKGVLVLIVTNILGVVFTLGLATPWAKVRSYRYRLEHLRVHVKGSTLQEKGLDAGAVGAFGDAATDLGDFDMDFG